ncbi:MAG: histidine--tRNA ligase [Candidatus Omnitrophica bacterium]|nr:histidine--tRNA ligase [Candidatus Omnitrophota bacterium]
MELQALRGTSDILPEDIPRWLSLERTIRRLARLYSYDEIRTPLLEEASLFRRSVGETTDIVQKEMFQFEDRSNQLIVLRPEGTASIVRAYLEHHLDKRIGFAKLFYCGAMFRAERPQAGRFRQFHQFGVEAIGSHSPWIDVEAITLCQAMLSACGLPQSRLWLSSMGCKPDQLRASQKLRERLSLHRSSLCSDCQSRFDKNIFRVLDCKKESCRAIVWKEKTSPFILCAECQAHYDQVRQGLHSAGISFDDTGIFARGLDYYTRTVFEFRAKGLGAQDAVAAGGRYNHLVEELGGPSTGAVGFAAGIERLLMAIPKGTSDSSTVSRHGIYVAVTQPTLIAEGFRLSQQLREKGIAANMDYDSKSLKAQLREADKVQAQYVAILGEAELAQQSITVKDLGQGTQRTIPLDQFIQEMSHAANHEQ